MIAHRLLVEWNEAGVDPFQLVLAPGEYPAIVEELLEPGLVGFLIFGAEQGPDLLVETAVLLRHHDHLGRRYEEEFACVLGKLDRIQGGDEAAEGVSHEIDLLNPDGPAQALDVGDLLREAQLRVELGDVRREIA